MKIDNLIEKEKIMKCLVLSVVLALILILNSFTVISVTPELWQYKAWCAAGQYSSGSPAQWKHEYGAGKTGQDICGTDTCLNIWDSLRGILDCGSQSDPSGWNVCCRPLVTTPTTPTPQCTTGDCCDGRNFLPSGTECGMRNCRLLDDQGYNKRGANSPATTSYCDRREYDNVPAYCSGYSAQCIFTPPCDRYFDTLEINTAGTCARIEGCDGNTPGTVVYYDSNIQGPTPDEYVLEGQNTADSTSTCKHQDWHCTGSSAAEVSDNVIQAEADICEYISGCSGVDTVGTVEVFPDTEICDDNYDETLSCQDGGGPENPGSDVLIRRIRRYCDGANAGCNGATEDLPLEIYDDCPDTSYCDPITTACDPLFTLTGLSSGLRLVDQDTNQDLREYVVGSKHVLLKEGNYKIADLTVNFDSDVDWSDIGANTNGEKTLLHIPDGHDEIIGDRIMYIPADKNTGTVYICPDAEYLSEVNPDCPGLYYLSNLPVVDGYYEVLLTETGGKEADVFAVEGWTQLVGAPYSPGYAISVSSVSIDGDYSLIIDDDSAADMYGVGSDFITIQRGETYTLSVDTNCTISMDIVLEVYNQTEISFEAMVTTEAVSTDWSGNNITVSTNADDEKVRIVFRSEEVGTGRCYFDNVRFVEGETTEGITPPPEGLILEGCCPSDSCWDGTTCIQDMIKSGEDPVVIGSEFLRCVGGDWVEPIVRYDWDNNEFGFCKREDQCFVNESGTVDNDDKPEMYVGLGYSENPKCIGDGQFIEDHYCDNGKWTSRTKFIATQLLDISGSTDSFTLYCDSYDKIFLSGDLSSTQETMIRGLQVVEGFAYYSCFLEEYGIFGYMAPCINSICRLDYNTDKTIFGMSVNKPLNFSLDSPPRYFLEDLFSEDRSYCNSLFGSNTNFTKCNNDPLFWYSDRLNSIIKPAHPVDFEAPSVWDGIVNFFIELFGGAPVDPLSAAIDFSFLDQTKDFNRICISKQGDKTAYMVVELPKPSMLYIAARYENIFDFNVCNFIDDRTFSADGTRICTQTGNNFTIYAGVNITADPGGKADVDLLWDDLVGSCLNLG
jgi:hypothetical protein